MALPAHAKEPERLPRSFKGMELYSWRDAKTQAWHYSILIGTNRTKSLAEIKDTKRRIDSVDRLKERLAKFALGELVGWQSVDADGGFPDPSIIAEINDAARNAGVDLVCACLPER